MNKSLYVFIATLAGIGYLPAPGTMASLASIPLVMILKYSGLAWYGEFIATILISISAYWCIERARSAFSGKDPRPIVLDECLGMLLVFIGIPLHWLTLVVGFVVFRLFDVSKICGLVHVEQLPGTWGIMLDDLVAGGLTNLVLHALLLCIG